MAGLHLRVPLVTKPTQATRSIPIDLGVKLHARRAISRIVELSDRAEDCAEQIELVAVKSVS